jgi:hypothetical protein
MFHALEMTCPSSYRILYVPGRSTWWTMNGPLPRGRELVSILVALNSSEDQVSDVELTRTHVVLVVTSQGLLVLGAA